MLLIEFKIGNIVQGAPDLGFIIINKIINEDYNKIISGYYINKPTFSASNEQLSPITLTEEWLTNFGFVIKEFKKDHATFELNNLLIHNIWHSNKWGNFYFDWEGNNEILIYTINQLQNLYFELTRKELLYDKIE